MNETDRPTIVCLCGSTRFTEAYQRANLEETLAGKIVLTIGCDLKSDRLLFREMSDRQIADLKQALDTLHLRKIDLADEVYILNVAGYIGESTNREIAYAVKHGKRLRFLEPAMQCPCCHKWLFDDGLGPIEACADCVAIAEVAEL